MQLRIVRSTIFIASVLSSSIVLGSQVEENARKVGAPDIPKAERCDARIIENSIPKYPREAIRAGAEGWVLIDVWLGADGQVKGVKLSDSKGWKRFQEISLQAVGSTKYGPGEEVVCKSLFTFTIS